MKVTLNQGTTTPVAIEAGQSVSVAVSSTGAASVAIPGEGVAAPIAASASTAYGPYAVRREVIVNVSAGSVVIDVQNGAASASAVVGAESFPAYTGFVATRGQVSNNIHPTNKQANVRTAHHARDNITSLQVMLGAFAVLTTSSNAPNTGTGAETSVGGAITYECAIEYPAGTYTRVTFGGSTQGTCPAGSTLISDTVAVVIPYGSQFWVRQFINSAGTLHYYQTAGLTNSGAAMGEQVEFAVSGLSSKVLGGSIASATAAVIYPLAIIGNTTRPSVLGFGDSRIAGQGDTFDTSGLIGHVMRAVGGRYGFAQSGIPSDRANWAVTNFTQRLKLVPYASHIVVQYGINDLNGGGRTDAQTLTDLQTIWSFIAAQKRSTCKVYQCTLDPFTTSTDSWATLANQTVASFESFRVSLNTTFRTTAQANIDGFIEIADAVESGRNTGKWQVTGSANGFTSDGVHGGALANLAVARSGEFLRKLGLPA
jgi:lysophospholipase L1-like esterase